MTDDDQATGESRQEWASEEGRTHYDWATEESIAAAIHRAIESVNPDHDPCLGPPLQSIVDVDALERLFGPGVDGDGPAEGVVWFGYGPYEVSVAADGLITVRPREWDGREFWVDPGDRSVGEREFREQLLATVWRAEMNGVDVEGGWSIPSGTPGTSRWDVQLTAVSDD